MDNVFDFDDTGEGFETGQPAATEEALVETVSNEDVEVETTQDETPESTNEASDTALAAEASDDEIATLEAEVEKALADEKAPPWLKNAVKRVYKPKIAALSEQLGTYEPLQNYGSVEEIGQKLELLNSLNTIRSNPQTGMPELSTEDFVTKIFEQDPNVAYQLLNDLANLPSPYTQGWTVLQEMYRQTGIDPTRLDDIKAFVANGYQLQQGAYPPPDESDLALIPEHLQATFAALSPERRDSLLFEDNEAVRNAALEDARIAREAESQRAMDERTKGERESQEQTRREAEFRAFVESKGAEHFEKTSEAVFTSFVESLAKQANMTQMDSLMITNLVLNSLEPTLAGRQSLEALKAEGITIDPAIPATITQMEENAKHIAYYEAVRDTHNVEKAVAKQVELQERLIAKGNKIIAAVAHKKATGTAQTIQSQTSKLANTQSQRYATAGVGSTVGSNGQPNYDFSDESYLDDLRAGGFGNGR